jgi:hypothetical protein
MTPLPLLTIPIFPLRKMVKLPTDNITLNLYESRYIQMMEEAVLKRFAGTNTSISSNQYLPSIPLFGAMYTTHIPHIVVTAPKTTGPSIPTADVENTNVYIVPIIEPDMFGSLFVVTNHTTTIRQNKSKVIQLNATALLRFRIVKVIHTGGYDDLAFPDMESQRTDNQNVPYIVAQVQLLFPEESAVQCSDEDSAATRVDIPHNIFNLISQYGPTILPWYFGRHATSERLPLLEAGWVKELLYFYNVTSSSSSDNAKSVVPSYQEQKERLRILSQ